MGLFPTGPGPSAGPRKCPHQQSPHPQAARLGNAGGGHGEGCWLPAETERPPCCLLSQPWPWPAQASLPGATGCRLSRPLNADSLLLGAPRLKKATHGCGGSSAPAQVTVPPPPAPPTTSGQARDRACRKAASPVAEGGKDLKPSTGLDHSQQGARPREQGFREMHLVAEPSMRSYPGPFTPRLSRHPTSNLPCPHTRLTRAGPSTEGTPTEGTPSSDATTASLPMALSPAQ